MNSIDYQHQHQPMTLHLPARLWLPNTVLRFDAFSWMETMVSTMLFWPACITPAEHGSRWWTTMGKIPPMHWPNSTNMRKKLRRTWFTAATFSANTIGLENLAVLRHNKPRSLSSRHHVKCTSLALNSWKSRWFTTSSTTHRPILISMDLYSRKTQSVYAICCWCWSVY